MTGRKLEERYIGSVKVGAKGQIVIPKEVREMFGIEQGDTLVILADRDKGIAIQQMDVFRKIADAFLEGKTNDRYLDQDEKAKQEFVEHVKRIKALNKED